MPSTLPFSVPLELPDRRNLPLQLRQIAGFTVFSLTGRMCSPREGSVADPALIECAEVWGGTKTMKKVVQLSALLFIIALVVAAAPAVLPSAHAGAGAAVLSAQAAQAPTYAQAQDPNQNPPAAQPQDQNPPNDQNPNTQDPNAMGTPRARGRHLPKTASPLPELALIGFFSLLGIIVIRRVVRNMA